MSKAVVEEHLRWMAVYCVGGVGVRAQVYIVQISQLILSFVPGECCSSIGTVKTMN